MTRLADTVVGVIGVVEIGRPKRPTRRSGAKSDALDAIRAAREALACDHPVAPRRRGDRQALRVLLATRHSACRAKVSAINQLKALIVGAPEELRAELRGLGTKRQVRRCARLRERPTRSLEHRMTVRALRSTAQRIQLLAAEAAELRAELERLVAASAPWLVELPGVGPISAAQVLVSWSHPRLRCSPEVGGQEHQRCSAVPQRAVARQLFKLLEHSDHSTVEPLRVA